LKKIPETDAIFENVFAANQAADDHPGTLRLSIDSKAKVKIGNLSRGGKDRGLEAVQADDHDSEWQAVLVPFGILNTQTDQLSIYFGQSAETSDFIVDCLSAWWQENQAQYTQLEQLVIDLDGGSATRSNRTQFIKRMVQFSQTTQLKVHLVYYPPYHSKYNPIERCWATLENYWNGTVLNSVEAALHWAANMTWKGGSPIVHLVKQSYEKAIKVPHPELEPYLSFWQRCKWLPDWDITIVPTLAN
jgi:transposase